MTTRSDLAKLILAAITQHKQCTMKQLAALLGHHVPASQAASNARKVIASTRIRDGVQVSKKQHTPAELVSRGRANVIRYRVIKLLQYKKIVRVGRGTYAPIAK